MDSVSGGVDQPFFGPGVGALISHARRKPLTLPRMQRTVRGHVGRTRPAGAQCGAVMDAGQFVAQMTICQVRGHGGLRPSIRTAKKAGAARELRRRWRCSEECHGDLPQTGVAAQRVRRR
jgi:hypothetical protein